MVKNAESNRNVFQVGQYKPLMCPNHRTSQRSAVAGGTPGTDEKVSPSGSCERSDGRTDGRETDLSDVQKVRSKAPIELAPSNVNLRPLRGLQAQLVLYVAEPHLLIASARACCWKVWADLKPSTFLPRRKSGEGRGEKST